MIDSVDMNAWIRSAFLGEDPQQESADSDSDNADLPGGSADGGASSDSAVDDQESMNDLIRGHRFE